MALGAVGRERCLLDRRFMGNVFRRPDLTVWMRVARAARACVARTEVTGRIEFRLRLCWCRICLSLPGPCVAVRRHEHPCSAQGIEAAMRVTVHDEDTDGAEHMEVNRLTPSPA